MRGFASPEDERRDRARAARAAARGLSPKAGSAVLAVYASGSRKKTLPNVAAPTLVIHGADDPLLPLAHGEDTAATIPGAKLVALERMGHSLAVAHWPRMIDEIAAMPTREEQRPLLPWEGSRSVTDEGLPKCSQKGRWRRALRRDPHPAALRAPPSPARGEGNVVAAYAPTCAAVASVDRSSLTPGPMVEEIAARWR